MRRFLQKNRPADTGMADNSPAQGSQASVPAGSGTMYNTEYFLGYTGPFYFYFCPAVWLDDLLWGNQFPDLF